MLSRVPFRRFLLGDITTTPEYQAAVTQLTNQLTLEGQSSFDIQGSVQSMNDTFNQLLPQVSSATDALQASLNYTLGSKSYGAAADMVQGLLTAATSGASSADLLEAFTGTMIGVMVLAGAASAGVGAAVMGAVAIVIGILQQLGFFPGSTPPGTALPSCPSISYTGQGPSYQLATPGFGGQTNVVYAWPDPYWSVTQNNAGLQPGAPFWRKFPVQITSGNPIAGTVDFFWFAGLTPPQGGAAFVSWPQTLTWQPTNDNKPLSLFFCVPSTALGSPFTPGFRLVDAAFPVYHQMECEIAAGQQLFSFITGGQSGEIVQALTNFDAAFFAALQLNWEYALNGIKPPGADLDVLIHTIYTWNRAHEPGQGWDIVPDSTSSPWMPNGTACSGNPPWYAAILASNAGVSQQYPTGVLNGGKLHINTGAIKPFSLKGQGVSITKSGAAAAGKASSSSGAGLLVVGVLAAAAGGTYYYYRKHPEKFAWLRRRRR